MKGRRDITYGVILCIVVTLTIGFTVFYIFRLANPVSLLAEEIYILYDGREQTITGVYHLRNHLPVNAAIPLEYPLPVGDGLGDAVPEQIIFGTPDANRPVKYKFSDKNIIILETGIPPFGDGQLAIKFHQIVTGESLKANIMSAGPWGPARDEVTAYLKLPADCLIGHSNLGAWQKSTVPGWDWTVDLSSADIDGKLEIKLIREESSRP